MKSKLLKIPTLIGIVVLVVAIAAGVILIQGRQIFRLGASPESSPKDVRITNINNDSFSVSWTTNKEVSGSVVWGSTSSNLTNTETDELQTVGTIHYTTIRGLSPNLTYYFKINSEGHDYDNDGTAWSAKTGADIGSPETSDTISGTVLTATGSPASKIVVYVSVAGSSPISTTTSTNGSWVIPISNIRTTDLGNYKTIDETSDVIEIFAQAGNLGIATAQIYLQSAKPTPPIILGQTHDFRDLPPSSSTGDNPSADITSLDEGGSYSRFNVPEDLPQGTDTVSIKSVEEGEKITTTKPEFFGEGPAGTQISIKLESQTPINSSVTVSNSGTWQWTPPSNLPPGDHKITLTWTDENGLLKTLVKSFTVQAAEGPAFESTPSASPKTTISPSASSTPSATASSSGTPFPQPQTGIATNTLILFVAGFILISLSSIAYAFAREDHGK